MSDVPKYALVEIERRWLADLAAVEGLAARPFRAIDDLYIAGSRLRLRRVVGPSTEVTFKLGKKYGKSGAFSEPITNVYLTEGEYERLAVLPGARTLKRRYSVSGGSLDVYLEPAGGIAVFEIEFRDERSAEAYRPPSFTLREITHDAAFTGAALAAGGAGAARSNEGES